MAVKKLIDKSLEAQKILEEMGLDLEAHQRNVREKMEYIKMGLKYHKVENSHFTRIFSIMDFVLYEDQEELIKFFKDSIRVGETASIGSLSYREIISIFDNLIEAELKNKKELFKKSKDLITLNEEFTDLYLSTIDKLINAEMFSYQDKKINLILSSETLPADEDESTTKIKKNIDVSKGFYYGFNETYKVLFPFNEINKKEISNKVLLWLFKRSEKNIVNFASGKKELMSYLICNLDDKNLEITDFPKEMRISFFFNKKLSKEKRKKVLKDNFVLSLFNRNERNFSSLFKDFDDLNLFFQTVVLENNRMRNKEENFAMLLERLVKEENIREILKNFDREDEDYKLFIENFSSYLNSKEFVSRMVKNSSMYNFSVKNMDADGIVNLYNEGMKRSYSSYYSLFNDLFYNFSNFFYFEEKFKDEKEKIGKILKCFLNIKFDRSPSYKEGINISSANEHSVLTNKSFTFCEFAEKLKAIKKYFNDTEEILNFISKYSPKLVLQRSYFYNNRREEEDKEFNRNIDDIFKELSYEGRKKILSFLISERFFFLNVPQESMSYGVSTLSEHLCQIEKFLDLDNKSCNETLKKILEDIFNDEENFVKMKEDIIQSGKYRILSLSTLQGSSQYNFNYYFGNIERIYRKYTESINYNLNNAKSLSEDDFVNAMMDLFSGIVNKIDPNVEKEIIDSRMSELRDELRILLLI